ncbi:cellulose synthase-like protein G3 [Malania oleifera]|uniref:cellulose synthase-like protein G3 n=1 Tax=Malania oleifera TaxID=397392 RepID=UPI0025ADE430|nr:cellulose synthase-like protein G3 [Malania oleifera]
MDSLPLNLSKPIRSAAIANRLHALIHSIALASFIYYRASSLLSSATNRSTSQNRAPVSELLIFASELLLSILWLLNQAFLWLPISRVVFPERLPADEKLPAIDVFVVTADPRKEPPLGVMNTVLSAMALDYPPDKLSVYLSDDGASPLTYFAVQEAWVFARSWLPFCRRYGIQCRCPEAYFSDPEYDAGSFSNRDFLEARDKIKMKYELFKEQLMRAEEDDKKTNGVCRPPVVQVMNNCTTDAPDTERAEMPLLIYVSREKKLSHPHHFKAGALNVLLRVSGIISNAPYILVLDCDMYSNDPTSARQAMCFHLDPKMSPSLAFVQFPQAFHNVSENDIHGGSIRNVFVVKWPGMDGLRGPCLSGTGFYMKRHALYGGVRAEGVEDIHQLKESFGSSNDFIKSIRQGHQGFIMDTRNSSNAMLREAVYLASCTYEKQTRWGEQIGFLYNSVAEDYFTSFILHCNGWASVYCNPPRPAFLGSATINFNDSLVQNTRWSTGLLEVGLSRFCPLIFGSLRMSILESMCYASLAFYPLYFFPSWCIAIISSLTLLNGIPMYPKVSSSWSILFLFICLSSLLEHLAEVYFTGGSICVWWNEVRNWMIKSATSNFFGSLDVMLKMVGLRQSSFLPTNKVVNEEQVKQYQRDIFDFQTSTMLLAPLVTLVILNMVAFFVGVARMIIAGSWDELLGQVLLSFFILLVLYPVIEGMVLRKDNGRIPPDVTFLSVLCTIIILSLGSIVFMW